MGFPLSKPSPTPAPANAETPPVSFWQNPLALFVVPVGSSLLLHIAVILGIWLTMEVAQVATTPAVQEQIIVPEGVLIDGAEVGGVPNPGLGGDPNRPAAQDQVEVQMSDGWGAETSQYLTANLLGGRSGESDLSIATIGIGGSAGLGGRGISGDPAGGGLAPFGVPGGGGGIGPRAPFAGISGNGRRIVYVCDASGTMMSIFDGLRSELENAIAVLRPSQAFNILFFADEDVYSFNKQGLVPANTENRQKAMEFTQSVSARGKTDPFPALKAAFAQKPELMYVLTDGFDQISSLVELVEEFRRLNADKKVRVNMILVSGAGIQQELVQTMKQIAAENGGVFRMAAKSDF